MEHIVDGTVYKVEFPVLHKSGARIEVVLYATTRRGPDGFQQIEQVLQRTMEQILDVPIHGFWKKMWSLSRLFPEAQLGAYPRTDRRRTGVSDLEKIVELVSLTSATADCRVKCGCANSTDNGANVEVTSIRVSIDS